MTDTLALDKETSTSALDDQPDHATHFIGFRPLLGVEIAVREGAAADPQALSRIAIVWTELLAQALEQADRIDLGGDVRIVRVHREGNMIHSVRRAAP